MKKIRLVNTLGSSNKFYIMEQMNEHMWRASYGRIEKPASAQHASYSMWEWEKKYQEKLKKGYRIEGDVILSFEDVFAALDALEAQMRAQEEKV